MAREIRGKMRKLTRLYHVIRPRGNPGMLSGYPLGIPRGRFFSSPVYDADMNVPVLLLLCLPTAVAVLLWQGKKVKNEKGDASLPCYPPARKPGDVIRVSPGHTPGTFFFVPCL